MWVKAFIVIAVLFAFPDGGEKEGRRGNKRYEREQYAEAADLYRSGLETADPADGRTYFGLLNNLGASLYRMDDYENAKKVLDQALNSARSDQDFSHAAYNAGNTAVQMQDLQNAVDYYRKSLLANPANEDAKFNYEFARRRLEEQQQQQQQQQQGGSSNNDQQNEENQDNQGQNPEESNSDPNQQDEQQQNEQDRNQPSEDQNQEEPRDAPEPQANEDREQMSRQEAERILQALQNEEEELLREAQRLKSSPRRVEKDW